MNEHCIIFGKIFQQKKRKSKAITNLELQKQGTSVRITQSWPASDYGHSWRAKFRRGCVFSFVLFCIVGQGGGNGGGRMGGDGLLT